MFRNLVAPKLVPLVTGVACFLTGWQIHPGAGPTDADRITPPVGRNRARAMAPFAAKGTALIVEWFGRLEKTDDGDLEKLASGLLHNSHRDDPALWAPLLARWSAVDGAGMISFLEKEASPALRSRLLENAWFAWGASDPDAAFEAARKLPPALVESLLEGIAETDPRKAAEFVTMVPNSQFSVGHIAARITRAAPDLAEDLLARAVYDGARYPFEQAKISELAATDPAGAIAFARSRGAIGFDPVPRAVREIAAKDPAQAAAQVDAMPSSRSKALSSVALAETWAAQDPDAAVKWIRDSLTGPVLQNAMVAAAAASGSNDPAKALDLVVEAGWISSGDFFDVRDSETIIPGEAASAPNARSTAVSLLQQLSRTDPETARRYLREKIPAGMRDDLAGAAGITP